MFTIDTIDLLVIWRYGFCAPNDCDHRTLDRTSRILRLNNYGLCLSTKKATTNEIILKKPLYIYKTYGFRAHFLAILVPSYTLNLNYNLQHKYLEVRTILSLYLQENQYQNINHILYV